MEVVKVKWLKGEKVGKVEDKFIQPAEILKNAGLVEFVSDQVKEEKAETETKELKSVKRTKRANKGSN